MLPRFLIFCGKGGVGKTALALASGLSLARRGRRVLLVTSHPVEELALTVSLDGLQESSPEVAARLFVVHIDSRQVLRRMIRDRFPAGFVADRLLGSTIYQSFVEVVPGLKEFAFLHRLEELAERRAGATVPGQEPGARLYDHVVWDAPATGHFLQTLKVAVNFESFFAGPLASRSREVSEYFRKSPLRVIPVALPEEMSVEETLDLTSELRRLDVGWGPVACNLVSPMLARDAAGTSPPLEPSGTQAARFLARRLASEREEFDRLRSAVAAPCVLLRRLPKPARDLDLLWALAGETESAGLFKHLEPK